MKKIFAIVLACMMLIPCLAGLTSFAAEVSDVEIVGKNVWFGGALFPMVGVNDLEECDRVEVEFDDETYDCIKVYDERFGSDVFVAPYGVAAQNVTKEFTFTAYDKSGVASETYTFSVLQYLFERIYEDTDTEEDELAAHEALIAYAIAADAYHNGGANNVADKRFVNKNGEVSVMNVGDEIDLTVGAEPSEGMKWQWTVTDEKGNLKAVLENGATYEVAANHAIITVAEVSAGAAELVDTTYIFANYTAGTQYAEETHQLDETLSLYCNVCHFTTELRIYDSNTNDGIAILTSVKPMHGLTVNVGNKTGTLSIYGSNDGVEYELIQEVSITSTSYNDYSVEFENSYKYVKLDSTGGTQLRIKTMTVTAEK